MESGQLLDIIKNVTVKTVMKTVKKIDNDEIIKKANSKQALETRVENLRAVTVTAIESAIQKRAGV